MKTLLLFIILLSISLPSWAVFDLPLGIELGKTKLDDIEGAKYCYKENSPLNKKNKAYNNEKMGGKCLEFWLSLGFIATRSDTDTVKHLKFTKIYPKKWRQLGVYPNIKLETFKAILDEAKIKYKILDKITVRGFDESLRIEFFENNYEYHATFTDTNPGEYKYVDLKHIWVSESF